jgi:hypothetical protein
MKKYLRLIVIFFFLPVLAVAGGIAANLWISTIENGGSLELTSSTDEFVLRQRAVTLLVSQKVKPLKSGTVCLIVYTDRGSEQCEVFVGSPLCGLKEDTLRQPKNVGYTGDDKGGGGRKGVCDFALSPYGHWVATTTVQAGVVIGYGEDFIVDGYVSSPIKSC